MNRDQPDKFDEQVRKSLAELQPNYRPMSWDKLSERLEEQEPTATDLHIRQSLNALTPTYDPASWEKLQQRLDDQDNAATDAVVQQRLDNLPPPAYQPSSWAKLAARLELIAERRSCLAAFKITEIATLFSLLLLFWHFFPRGGFGPEPPAPVYATTFPVERPALVTKKAPSKTEAPQPKEGLATGLTQVPAASQTANIPTSSRETRPITPLPSATFGQVTATYGATGPIAKDRPITDFLPTPTYTLADFRTPPSPALQLQPVATGKELDRSLRFFVSPWDYNQVVTPAFSVGDKDVARDNRFTYGLSAGVLFDNDHGKNGHSYGIVYGRRSYLPTVIADAEGADLATRPSPLAPRDTNYSRITFHSVSLPFSYQREILNNGRWRLLASVGVEANLVLTSKFYKSPNFDENINNYLRQVNQNSSLARSISSQKQLTANELTNPERGLLQGGSALTNSSFYFNLGVALERRLGARTSLFVAPHLTRAIYYRRYTGLGPFDDRIHHNAVRFGVRYDLLD